MHEMRSLPQYTLPVPLTPLVGREREVAAVCAFLSRPGIRLVTLTGTGGVGKTRLALEVAAAISSDFADGICFVDLAPLIEPDLVVSTIAQALGVREQASRPLLDDLKDSLREKQFLLLLDNFEQIISAALVVVELLMVAPALKVVVTSRASLHLYGEHPHSRCQTCGTCRQSTVWNSLKPSASSSKGRRPSNPTLPLPRRMPLPSPRFVMTWTVYPWRSN
jgi:Cdc6-like AAA superfamily ATPase